MHLPSITVAVYFAGVLLIAFRSARSHATSNGFFNATGKLPTWIATISFLAANCSGLEVIGLSGIAARYGVQAFQFYWMGAIPAMIFVSFVVLPVYRRNQVASVPEYLERRYGRRVRLLSAVVLLASTCITAGICLYALAETLYVFAGWSFGVSALITASVVTMSLVIAGFQGTARTEVLHFGTMLLGLVPLLYRAIQTHSKTAASTGTRAHLWSATPLISTHAPVDLLGVIFGLGVVVSFSYWCSDFLLMQRALSARTLDASRQVPLYAGFGKLLFSFFIVLPVILAGEQIHASGRGALDQTAPMLMQHLFSPLFLPLGILALAASLMSGLGANVAAFAAIWTQEIYRSSLRPIQSESHYILVGRIASIVCVVLSLAGAYATLNFESLSEFVLAIFSLALIPLFAVILMGLVRRTSSASALTGLVAGVVAGAFAHIAFHLRWLAAGSSLDANLYVAVFSFVITSLACIIYNLFQNDSALREVAPRFAGLRPFVPPSKSQYVLGSALLAICILLNIIWR